MTPCQLGIGYPHFFALNVENRHIHVNLFRSRVAVTFNPVVQHKSITGNQLSASLHQPHSGLSITDPPLFASAYSDLSPSITGSLSLLTQNVPLS